MNKQEIEKAINFFKYTLKVSLICGRRNGKEEFYKKSFEHFNTAIQCMEKQLTNGWTPVSERLPVKRCYPPVICCHVSDEWTDAAIVNNQGCFINSEGCQIYPTHWQPLPEAYKEVSDAERN